MNDQVIDRQHDDVQLAAAYTVGLLVRARNELAVKLKDDAAERMLNDLVAHVAEKHLCDADAVQPVGFEYDEKPNVEPEGVESYLSELASLVGQGENAGKTNGEQDGR